MTNKTSIGILNEAHGMELQAVIQYENHYQTVFDLDYNKLAAALTTVYKEEEEHYDQIGKRIKELGGTPGVKPDKEPKTGQGITEIFSFDSELEQDAIDRYDEFVAQLREDGDMISAALMEEIAGDEQKHLNVFRKIADHIQELGDCYLAGQV